MQEKEYLACKVWINKSFIRVTVWHHLALPRDAKMTLRTDSDTHVQDYYNPNIIPYYMYSLILTLDGSKVRLAHVAAFEQ